MSSGIASSNTTGSNAMHMYTGIQQAKGEKVAVALFINQT